MSPTVDLEATRSGGRLGGISTMVTQADICPTCGGQHEGRRRPFWDRTGRTEEVCPVMVSGPFPVMMNLPDPKEVVLELPGPELLGAPGSPTEPAEVKIIPRRLGQLPIPWPAPSFDEAYL